MKEIIRVRTLAEVGDMLGINRYLTIKIRNYIADGVRREYRDWGIPNHMIFGGNGYSISRFKKAQKEIKGGK